MGVFGAIGKGAVRVEEGFPNAQDGFGISVTGGCGWVGERGVIDGAISADFSACLFSALSTKHDLTGNSLPPESQADRRLGHRQCSEEDSTSRRSDWIWFLVQAINKRVRPG